MATFKVRIQDIREATVEIDASTENDALEKVKSAIDEDRVDLEKLHSIKMSLAVEKECFELEDIRKIVI